MGTDPGISMDTSVVPDYDPRPPAPPTSSAEQFMSGLAGGQELSMADQAATDRAHTFITQANQHIRAHVFAADNSVQKYQETEQTSQAAFMSVEQSVAAQIGPVDTSVGQPLTLVPPTEFMGPAPSADGGN